MCDEGQSYWWSENTGSVWSGPTWVDHWDAAHQSVYYENTFDGSVTWTRPQDWVPIMRHGQASGRWYQGAEGRSYNAANVFTPEEEKLMEELSPSGR